MMPGRQRQSQRRIFRARWIFQALLLAAAVATVACTDAGAVDDTEGATKSNLRPPRTPSSTPAPAPTPDSSGDGSGPPATAGSACVERTLTFSADDYPSVPASGSAFVWGGNATNGESEPYAAGFLSKATEAKSRGGEVFAYLEGPCGDTNGVDDGERDRCAGIHRAFNAQNAPNTPDTPVARWKPFTMEQLARSGEVGADYCEIDNLANNVTIGLNPLLAELKGLFDAGKIHCRLVLKNVDVDKIDAIREKVAPTPADANFIAPFHIFEDDNTGQKAALDDAMVRLKGPGAVTIISTDSNHYGSAFTPDKFLTCK
jgi:hypothetical protein